MELDESQCKCVESVHSNGKFLCASLYVTHSRVNICYLSLVTSSDPVGGVLPLFERLFGVKGYDCCLLCLAFGKSFP